jgi:cellulose biosynthesis protein BcsQ
MINQRGIVYTFYSFKGGVGRSMALANVAALLAKAGNRVLIIDWDLEAPGLEKYFVNPPSSLSGSRSDVPGVVDLVDAFAKGQSIDWRACLLSAYPFSEGKPISILTAGRENEQYVKKLQDINWQILFDEHGFGNYLEQLREEWVREYDFVLVDSRTGITDIGGLCTIHLPDALVMLFTANEQSVSGVIDVLARVWEKFKKMPVDRSKILAIPVPSRFENFTENKLAAKWKNIFSHRLSPVYKDWLPDKVTPADILEKLFIPYIPFWSFGEGLPVVNEGTSDPRSLGFSYDLIAKLLSTRIQWTEALQGGINVASELAPERMNELAEMTYNSFIAYEQRLVKEIFTRLIHPINNVRLTISADELFTKDRTIEVLDKLIDAGLLFRNKDKIRGTATIEIVNDSLVKYWERLNVWLEDENDFILWRHEINAGAKRWQSSEHDKSELLTGTAVRKAQINLQKREADLNKLEVKFINASSRQQRYDKLIQKLPLFVTSIVGIMAFGYLYTDYKESEIEAKRAQMELQYIQVRNNELLREIVNQRQRFDSLNLMIERLEAKTSRKLNK